MLDAKTWHTGKKQEKVSTSPVSVLDDCALYRKYLLELAVGLSEPLERLQRRFEVLEPPHPALPCLFPCLGVPRRSKWWRVSLFYGAGSTISIDQAVFIDVKRGVMYIDRGKSMLLLFIEVCLHYFLHVNQLIIHSRPASDWAAR